jgi:hypothetical protein
LPHLAFRQAATLAHFGARVLHPRALAPVLEAGIPVVVRNTADPTAPGTLLDAAGPEHAPTALAAADPVSWFRFRLPWYRRCCGRLLTDLEAVLGSPLHFEWPTASGPAQLLVESGQADAAATLLGRHLGRDNPPERRDGLAAIAVTGLPPEGARDDPRVGARDDPRVGARDDPRVGSSLFQKRGIQLRQRLLLDGGEALLLLVPADQRQRTVRALYEALSSREGIATAA